MNILQNIFSITNKESKNNKIYKVITILGIKFKILNKYKTLLKFIDINNNKTSELKDFVKNNNKVLSNILDNKIIENQKYIKIQNDELIYTNVFNSSILNSKWLKDKSFMLIKGASNYSFMFNLYYILDEIKPENILEFGLGQTSKMTTQYANYFDKSLKIVDHNSEWIDIFSKKLNLSDRVNIIHKNLINVEINEVVSDKYELLDDITSNNKFDLIIIDGPIGVKRKYPRTNVLDLIPNNIDSKKFIIILDDAEREGETNTANLIFKKLEDNNIKYLKSYKVGLKTQLIITSEQYEFLKWM